MPWKPKAICSYPGCQALTNDRYCDEHKKQVTKEQNLKSSKLYTYQWRKTSKAFLKEHPLCVHCEKEGRLTPATEVDHIIPHGGTENFSGTERTGSPFVKVVIVKRPPLRMAALGIGNGLIRVRRNKTLRQNSGTWGICKVLYIPGDDIFYFISSGASG